MLHRAPVGLLKALGDLCRGLANMYACLLRGAWALCCTLGLQLRGPEPRLARAGLSEETNRWGGLSSSDQGLWNTDEGT